MSTELLDLDERIGREIEDIERTVQLAADAWECVGSFPEQQEHFLNSLALNLHSFYNGLERIFETLARWLDPMFPSGERWHRDLLEQMAREMPGVRPAVLSAESVERLDEFLAFRHRVRNLYGFNLEEKRLHELLERLPQAWQSARVDIESFRSLLQRAALEDESRQ